MADRNKRIANKIFRVLPTYEESDFESYYKYLKRIIIELQGEERTRLLDEAIIALKGLEAVGADVEHDDVRRIIIKHTTRISKGVEGV